MTSFSHPICRPALLTLLFLLFLHPGLLAHDTSPRDKQLIGATAVVSFPLFGDAQVPAKVDTGAKTSVMHARNITLDMAARQVTFRPLESDRLYTLPLLRSDDVRSSNGTAQKRPFILLKVIINKKAYETEFSLTDRSKMKYPVLLGRAVLKNSFVVDVAY